jgi:hypothetical protein
MWVKDMTKVADKLLASPTLGHFWQRVSEDTVFVPLADKKARRLNFYVTVFFTPRDESEDNDLFKVVSISPPPLFCHFSKSHRDAS